MGDRADSGVYIRNKLRAAEAVGIAAVHHKLPAATSQARLAALIDALNADAGVHGIIVQLPLDSAEPIDADAVIERIAGAKDVDGLTALNAGRLARNDQGALIVPCTPKGCLRLVKSTGVPVEGAAVVVLGRSHIVGGPASSLFRNANGTVTTGHSRTKDLPGLCRTADILIVAIGKPELIRGSLKASTVSLLTKIDLEPLKGTGSSRGPWSSTAASTSWKAKERAGRTSSWAMFASRRPKKWGSMIIELLIGRRLN